MSLKQRISVLFMDEWFEQECFALWEAHLEWLAFCGFKRAMDRQEPPPLPVSPTGHEVVDMLARFIEQTGFVNAHLGLTSSDVVDNIRLSQASHGLRTLREGVHSFCIRFASTFDAVAHFDTVGFTHWQQAAPIKWQHRVGAWTAPLIWLDSTVPAMYAKKFGGPVGDGRSLAAFMPPEKTWQPFDWEPFDLAYPKSFYPIQSSDHTSEQQAVNWICAVAAQLHKIAADLRFLTSRQIVTPLRKAGHAGSSSMAHKTNPYKWEKVCSICRSVSTTQQEMWSVAAHNGLERTLDTSWQIKQLLKRAFTGLAEALDLMTETQFEVNAYASAAQLSTHVLQADSDAELTRRVLAGEDRWAAYLSLLKRQNS